MGVQIPVHEWSISRVKRGRPRTVPDMSVSQYSEDASWGVLDGVHDGEANGIVCMWRRCSLNVKLLCPLVMFLELVGPPIRFLLAHVPEENVWDK